MGILEESAKAMQGGPLITVVEEWTDEVGGGLKTLCIKIGYSELSRTESRKGSSTVAESSRVT